MHRSAPLFSLLALAAGFPLSAAVSPTPAPARTAADGSVVQLEKFVLIGSARLQVTEFASAVPVDVIVGEQLADTGFDDLSRALRANVPALNFIETTTGGGVTANKAINLRGLASDQVLVLVNGKRRHASAFVNNKPGVSRGAQAIDLSTIPVSAIERVEVLRDGASAQYGSDAIAGVLNIVLKQRSTGGQLDLKLGEYATGGGFTQAYSGWKSVPLPGRGSLTVAAESLEVKDLTEFAGLNQNPFYFAHQPEQEAAADRASYFRFYPVRSYTFFVNGDTHLNDRLSAYAFASYQRRQGKSGHAGVRPLEDTNVRGIFPDGHTFKVWNKSVDAAATAGLRYEHDRAGRFDLSANRGRNRSEFSTTDSNNPSYGLASPTSFYSGALVSTQTNLSLDYVRELRLGGLEEEIALTAGLTYRNDRYTIEEGEVASWADGGVRILDGPNAGKLAPAGNDGFPGFSPENAGTVSRDVAGLYAGVEAEILRHWQVAVAGRAERYDGFGGTATGKLATRLDLTPYLALRSAYNTAFRAPTAGQLGYSNTQTTSLNDQRAWVSTFPVDHPAARALGARDLKPERSRNYSAGLVLRPTRNASLAIDAYRIDVADRITFSENLSGPIVRRALDAAGFLTVGGANFFTNGLDTRTKGVDVVGKYRLALSPTSRADLALAYNWNETRVTRIDRGLSNADVLGRSAIGVIEHGLPEDRLTLGIDYRLQRWKVALTQTRFGRYATYNNTNPTLDQQFDAEWVTDLETRYDFGRYAFSVGAINLFDARPDYAKQTASSGGVFSYAASPFRTEGTFVYGKFTVSF